MKVLESGFDILDCTLRDGSYVNDFQFTAEDNHEHDEPTTVDIFAEAIDDAPTFTGGDDDISDRTKTS